MALRPLRNGTDAGNASAAEIAPGDIVRTGENLYPFYRVIATNGDRAWVRDIQYGTDHIARLERMRKVKAGRPVLVEDLCEAHRDQED